MGNVKCKEGFTQVCVWQNTLVRSIKGSNKEPAEFENWMKEQFGVRVQYLEEIETKPDIDSTGNIINGTGGRIDTFFAIHQDDIMKFAILRLQVGIRWIEDVLAPVNYTSPIYPERVFKYQTWKA